MAEQAPQGDGEFTVIPPGTDGYPRLPIGAFESVAAGFVRARIINMMPSEIAFVDSRSVALYMPIDPTEYWDTNAMRVTIDTYHVIPDRPTSEYELGYRPAAMKVIEQLGADAVEGYLVDVRHMFSLSGRDVGLFGTPTFDTMCRQNGTQDVLGIIASSIQHPTFVMPRALVPQAQAMVQRVDSYLYTLRQQNALRAHEFMVPDLPPATRPRHIRLDTDDLSLPPVPPTVPQPPGDSAGDTGEFPG